MPMAKNPKLFDIDNQAKNVVREDDEAFAFRVLARLNEDANGCWVWEGASSKGYGVITWGGHGSMWFVHRLVYGAFRGRIPDDLQIDHLCRNKACANPDHLEPVTGGENVRRHHALKTHCAQGHSWIPENIGVNRWKFCKICSAESQQRYYKARRKAINGG